VFGLPLGERAQSQLRTHPEELGQWLQLINLPESVQPHVERLEPERSLTV